MKFGFFLVSHTQGTKQSLQLEDQDTLEAGLISLPPLLLEKMSRSSSVNTLTAEMITRLKLLDLSQNLILNQTMMNYFMLTQANMILQT